jgi:hypothetical protein
MQHSRWPSRQTRRVRALPYDATRGARPCLGSAEARTEIRTITQVMSSIDLDERLTRSGSPLLGEYLVLVLVRTASDLGSQLLERLKPGHTSAK